MSSRIPDGGGWSPAPAGGPHTFRAVLIVVVAVALTVGLLTQLGAGPGGTASAGASTAGTATGPTGSTGTAAPATSSASSPTTSSTTTPLVPPSQIKLAVLNGLINGTLSSQWCTKLHSSPGYVTLLPNNTSAKDTTSAIYILKAGYQPEARALAATVGLPDSAIVTTVPPPSSAPIPSADLKADLVLVIGQTLAGKA